MNDQFFELFPQPAVAVVPEGALRRNFAARELTDLPAEDQFRRAAAECKALFAPGLQFWKCIAAEGCEEVYFVKERVSPSGFFQGEYQSLEEYVQLLEAVLEHSSVIVAVVNREGKYSLMNHYAAEFFGLTPEDTIGKLGPLDLHNPTELAAAAEEFNRVYGTDIVPDIDFFRELPVERNISFAMELNHNHPEAGTRTVRLNLTDLRAPGGQTKGIIAIGQDVTQMKQQQTTIGQQAEQLQTKNRSLNARVEELQQTQAALVEQRNLLESLMRFSREGIFIVDSEFNFRFLNERTRAYFSRVGRTPEVGDHFPDFESPENVADFRQKAERVFAGEELREEISFQYAETQLRYYDILYLPVYSAGAPGKVTQMAVLSRDISEVKDREHQLRLLIQNAGVGLLVTEFETGEILEINQKLATIVGGTVEGMLGRFAPDFYKNPEDRGKLLSMLQQEGQASDFITQIRRLSGEPFWAKVNANLLEYRGRLCLLVAFEDIDEAEKQKLALKKALHRLDLVNRATMNGIWDYYPPPDGDWLSPDAYLWFNDRTREIFGYENEEDFPNTVSSWEQNIHPQDHDYVMEQLREFIYDRSGRKKFDVEYRFRCKDGNYLWVNDIGVGERDSVGNLKRAIGSMILIHERKSQEFAMQQYLRQLEEARQQAETKRLLIQSIIDSTSDYILAVSAAGNIQYFNKAFADYCRQLGIEVYEGIPRDKVIREDRANDFTEMRAQVFRGVAVSKEMTYPRPGNQAEDQHLLMRYNPLFGPDKQVTGYIIFTSDITERKNAEEAVRRKNNELKATIDQLRQTQAQLIHAEKMSSLGQLTAGIAHEINNPINSVFNGVDILAEDVETLLRVSQRLMNLRENDTAELARYLQQLPQNELRVANEVVPELLEQIRLGAERTIDIVRGLRSFSRLDEQARKPVELHAGIDSTLLLLRSQLQQKIVVEKDYHPEIPPVTVFGGQMNQVFMNLLTNAIQSIQQREDWPAKPGYIQVVTRPDKRNARDGVSIRICDNGIGIPEEIRPKVFDPFFSTKATGQGTGLGLSISYGIVEEHQGEITFWSLQAGGTCFEVWIPMR